MDKFTVLKHAAIRNIDPLAFVCDNCDNTVSNVVRKSIANHANAPMTVPLNVTFLPKYTSPVTVK